MLFRSDSRLCPDSEAIKNFADNLENSYNAKTKDWFFGEKGAGKKSFVENFSAVLRKDFIIFGMMPERINQYGGMSQELRSRWTLQGGAVIYVPEAQAYQLIGSKTTLDRRNSIINMKFKLFKMYKGARY